MSASDEDTVVEIDDGDFEVVERDQHWRQMAAEMKARCDTANIGYRIIIADIDNGDEEYIEIEMPNGRSKRAITVNDIRHIETIIGFEFEKYNFLGDLMAFCSYEKGTIEAVFRPLDPTSSRGVFRRLGLSLVTDVREVSIAIEEEGRPVRIQIGAVSKELYALFAGYLPSSSLSLAIIGVRIAQHDAALHLLNKIADALFFQLDLSAALSLRLLVDRRARARPRRRTRQEAVLTFPKREFDEAPMSLYWYGRSATGMPLLQYLAFYQVLEFYFPAYSRREAGRRVQNVLKDPLFRSDRDADIARLLSTMRTWRGGAHGSEKEQLKATLLECVDAGEVRSFLEEYEDRKELFSAKQPGLTSVKLSIGNPTAELRTEIAELVYEIRCKIVHTKGDEQEDGQMMLLPFTREAELLRLDIELVQFLAQKVLIAASSNASF